jgi:hypothetical protein
VNVRDDRVCDLTRKLHPLLSEDPSGYAKGRLRVWLGTEPSLSDPKVSRPGLPLSDTVRSILESLIGWRFDYCLVTCSGSRSAGILPHRDASFADYEAFGLNLVGEATFSYWNDRQSFGKSGGTGLAPSSGPPTHVIQMTPGTLVRFNCKNVHACSPGPDRWGLNFWRAKP